MYSRFRSAGLTQLLTRLGNIPFENSLLLRFSLNKGNLYPSQVFFIAPKNSHGDNVPKLLVKGLPLINESPLFPQAKVSSCFQIQIYDH